AADSNIATVTITVTPVNDPPVANNDAYTTAEDTPLTVAAPGVLANDTDVDGNPLTAILVNGPSNGTLTLNPDGSFTYPPNAHRPPNCHVHPYPPLHRPRRRQQHRHRHHHRDPGQRSARGGQRRL